MKLIKILISGLLVIITLLCFGCQENQLTKIFQRDLKINVLFKNHKGLQLGAPVVLVESATQKLKIGKIKKIDRTSSGASTVEISIKHEFKKQLSTNNEFVLFSNPFSSEIDHIIVVDSISTYTPEPLKSGTVIIGKSYLEYSLMASRRDLNLLVGNMMDESTKLLNGLRQKINNLDLDLLKTQLKELIKNIEQLSEKQRLEFERKVLPKFKKIINRALKYFENHFNEQELKELKKIQEHYNKI
jgi:hypothetical protein